MSSNALSTNQPSTNAQQEYPSYGRILLPVDGSPLAEEALPAAMAFARRAGIRGKIILVRVSRAEYTVYSRGGPFEIPSGMPQEAEEYLITLKEEILAQGVSVETVNPDGDAALSIVDVANERHADLIILITHAREGMSRLVHGSVADRVLHGASVPVLLLKHGEPLTRIFSAAKQLQLLVPLDGSAVAESVLPQAIALAQQLNAAITLMCSLNLPDLNLAVRGRAASANAMIRGMIPNERRAVFKYLEQVQQRLQTQSISTVITITEGGAAEDIAAQAKALEEAGKPTIIVMATHGRSGIGRWLYGSVAGAVLHLADVPLFVIRQR